MRLLPNSSAPVKIDLELEITDPMSELKRKLIDRLLELKLLDTSPSEECTPQSTEDFEMVNYSDASVSKLDDKTAANSSNDETADSPKSIYDSMFFQFGCAYSHRPTMIYKTYEPDVIQNRAVAILSYVGKYDILMAFQVQHDAQVAKASSFYSTSVASKPLKNHVVDMVLGKKEKSLSMYMTDRVDVLGYPFRFTFGPTATYTDVLIEISNTVRRFIREDSPYCKSYESDNLGDRPYQCVISSSYSYSMKQTLEPSDQIFPALSPNDIVSVVWKTEDFVDHYDTDQTEFFRTGFSSSTTTKDAVEKKLTIYDCLEKFTEREKLASTETVFCGNCKEHLAPIKKFDLWSTPGTVCSHAVHHPWRHAC